MLYGKVGTVTGGIGAGVLPAAGLSVLSSLMVAIVLIFAGLVIGRMVPALRNR